MIVFVVEKRICNYKEFLYVAAWLEYKFGYFEKGPNFPRTFYCKMVFFQNIIIYLARLLLCDCQVQANSAKIPAKICFFGSVPVLFI